MSQTPKTKLHSNVGPHFRRMMIDEASPQSFYTFEHDFENTEANKRNLAGFIKQGFLVLEDKISWQLCKTKGASQGYYFAIQGDKMFYVMKYEVKPTVPKMFIQKGIWSSVDRPVMGIVTHVLFNHVLKDDVLVVTDSLQTPAANRMWNRIINEAGKNNKRFGYINTRTKEIVEAEDADGREFWNKTSHVVNGPDSKHRFLRYWVCNRNTKIQ